MSDQHDDRDLVGVPAALRAWAVPILVFGTFELIAIAGIIQGIAERTWWLLALSVLGLVLSGRILMKMARGFSMYRRGEL